MPQGVETDLTLNTQVKGTTKSVSALKKIDKGLDDIGLSARSLLGAAGLAGVALGIKAFGTASIQAAAQFEQSEIAFTTMLGSAEAAQALLVELANFAKTTPFELVGIESTAKQLLAMGITTTALMPTLKSLGDVSAGLSVPIERLALNFGQVATQGKLTGRELRDFAVAGVPLLAELSDMLGVSKSAIQEMVSAGEIGFDKVEQAFTNMTSEGGKFADLMDKQSTTFTGLVSNLADAWGLFLRNEGKKFLEWGKDVVKFLINFVDNILPQVIIGIENLSRPIISFGKLIFDLGNVIGKVFVGVIGGALKTSMKGWQQFFHGTKELNVDLGQGLVLLWNATVKAIVKSIQFLGKQIVGTMLAIEKIPGIDLGADQLRRDINGLNGVLTDATAGINYFKSVTVNAGSAISTSWEDINGSIGGGASASQEASEKSSKAAKKAADEFEKLSEKVSGLRKSYTSFGEKTEVSLSKLEADHSKNLSKIKNNIDGLTSSLVDLQNAFDIDIQGVDTSTGERVIKQREKILDIQTQIKELSQEIGTGEEVGVLEGQLKKEEAALEKFLSSNVDIQDEVDEAERRAKLTSFERFIEDQNKRKEELEKNFEEKKLQIEADLLLQEEAQSQEEAIFDKKRKAFKLTEIAFNNFQKSFNESIKDMESVTAESVGNMLENFEKLKRVSEFSGTQTNLIENTIEPRANGGPVNAGQTYLVGEQGAELFTPKISGNISPNGGMGGLTMYISGIFGSDAADEIGDMVYQKLVNNVSI